MDIYEKLAREYTYTKESYERSFDKMLEQVLASFGVCPPELIQKLKEGGKAAYEQALELTVTLMREVYTEQEAQTLYDINIQNPWLSAKQRTFSEEHWPRFTTQISNPLNQRLFEEFMEENPEALERHMEAMMLDGDESSK